MKLALIAVTARGALLAARAAEAIRRSGKSADCYAKAGRSANTTATLFESLSQVVAENWTHYDGFVFIMATGIVVRVIAPHLENKREDPAVVVLDERAVHAISLLSGHLGQANRLTVWLAGLLGATPVITTATDLAGKVAPDVFAAELGCRIEPFERLKSFNAALAEGEEIRWLVDRQWIEFCTPAANLLGINLSLWQTENKPQEKKTVIVSDRLIEYGEETLFLRPPVLAVGVGCRRGTSGDAIYAAIEETCRLAGRSIGSVSVVASVDVKADEAGLLEAVRRIGAAASFYSPAELAEVIAKYKLKESDFVRKQIGVGNICEAAVIKTSRQGTLLVPRTRYPNITVALAEVGSA